MLDSPVLTFDDWVEEGPLFRLFRAVSNNVLLGGY